MSLEVNVTKRFDGFTLHAAFTAGDTATALLGASGCGKSMTLRCIAGIVRPDEGRIVLDGRVLFDSTQGIDLPPQQRNVGLLFQNYALFPNMTVEQNILCALKKEKDPAARRAACAEALRAMRLPPEIRHLANTAATLSRPEIHFELTRPGIGLYGYEADPAMGTPSTYSLKPAMTLQAQLGTVKDVEAGHGISYGRTYLTPSDTSTAIVPLGYADGIHRSASGFDMEGAKHVTKPGGPVRVMTAEGPRLYRVSGRVCMDQFILDLHGSAAELGIHEGDNVELFGPGRGEDYAEPTADDWGRAADTISYEIFTCLRNRIPRLYEHATDVLSAGDLAKLDPASIL